MFGGFCNQGVGPARLPLVPSSLCPCSGAPTPWLRDEGARPTLHGILLTGNIRAKISAFTNDITVFGSRRRDILAVKKAVVRYEKVACAKVNFDKNKGFWLGSWRGSIPLPGSLRWSDGPVHILGMWFGPDLQLERNWLEVQAKVKAQVVAWLQRRLSLKGRAEVCAMYIFSLILYHLSVLPLPKDHRVALIQSLFKLLWKGWSLLVHRQVCYQRPRDWGLGMPDLEIHRLAERLAYLAQSLTRDAVWSLKVGVTFPDLRLYSKVEGRCRPRDEPPFVSECRRALRNLPRSSDLSWSRKELYWLLVSSASGPLVGQLGWSAEEICSQWNWAPGLGFLNNSEFSLTWRLAWNALALNNWACRACIADMPDCSRCGSGLEETALHAFYYCKRVHPFWSHVKEWTAHISPRELVLLDVGYVVDNVNPPFQGKKRVVFLVILAVARMVIW